MKLSEQDPRLTAYALGELDPAEQAQIESEIQQSPTMQRAVQEIQITAQKLVQFFQTETPDTLQLSQEVVNMIENNANQANGTAPNADQISETSATVGTPPVTAAVPPAQTKFKASDILGYVILLSVGLLIFVGLFSLNNFVRQKNTAMMFDTVASQLPGDAPASSETGKIQYGGPAGPAMPPPQNSPAAGRGLRRELKEMEALKKAESRSKEKSDRFAAGSISPSQNGAMPAKPMSPNAALEAPAPGRSQGIPSPKAPTAANQPASGAPGPVAASPSNDSGYAATERDSLSALGAVADPAAPAEMKAEKQADAPELSLVEPLPAQEPEPPLTPLDEQQDLSREGYDRIVENDFIRVNEEPLSTFSIDVDTASYANVRSYLQQYRQMPPADAVRIEELLNYFPYDYAPPADTAADPFAVHLEVAPAPWAPKHQLARIGIKGKKMQPAERPVSNLVFLLDTSGSMQVANKLPLLQDAMELLTQQLGENDRVAIVAYAGSAGLVLPATTAAAENKSKIIGAFRNLQAGGSTAGGAGIQLAYQVALDNFISGGVNRVILATDGDFNVGISDDGSLTRLIEEKAKSGVFLSVLGFGRGNYQDAKMEKLADKGNGNYAYIDTIAEARKVLVEQLSGTLVTIAKDVKIQIEFNPLKVGAYRLIGYENRLLAAQDFNDDTKDAGEIGAGHTVTALYELVPPGETLDKPTVDPLKYQANPQPAAEGEAAQELFTLKLRYKDPDGDTSKLIERPVSDIAVDYTKTSKDFRFAASVASFGMVLRGSKYKGQSSYPLIRELAGEAVGNDPYRQEFIQLVEAAEQLKLSSDSR